MAVRRSTATAVPPLSRPAARRALRAALARWYAAAARDLPWRATRDPYRVWLSEVMLQQTQVVTVLPYYDRFLAAFPTAADLAAAPQEHVLKLWEGLGYYSRGRHLHAAARVIVGERGGRFPRTAADWQTLPGVGRYTAAAIASIVHGEPAAVLDGNVKRVLARLFLITDPIDASATQARLWTLADELLDRAAPGGHNQAMMELGARVCTPRRPRCDECPVARWCAARAAGRTDGVPVRGPRRAATEVQLAVALVRRGERLLLLRRPSRGQLGGLWELPTVTVSNGTPPDAALVAGLRESLRLPVRIIATHDAVAHAFTHRRLTLYAFTCAPTGRPPAATADRVWVSPEALADYGLGRMYHKVLRLVFASAVSDC